MPTYAYRCESCGVEFERVQKFTDKPLTRCPECNKGKVRRIPQASTVVFKGAGWYVTDSKGKSSTVTSKPTHKSDSSSDSKPESKPSASDE